MSTPIASAFIVAPTRPPNRTHRQAPAWATEYDHVTDAATATAALAERVPAWRPVAEGWRELAAGARLGQAVATIGRWPR